jgi:hypothetical protein
VDAGLLRRCCHRLKDQIDPRGIRLQNAAIEGTLDLAGLDARFPLRFEGCEFDSPPMIEGAQLYELRLSTRPRSVGAGYFAHPGDRLTRSPRCPECDALHHPRWHGVQHPRTRSGHRSGQRSLPLPGFTHRCLRKWSGPLL